MKSIALTTLLLMSYTTMAGDLKKTAFEAFLKQANNSQSVVGKIISAVNEQNSDGRNPNGSIKLPIKRADIQVARLASEEITNPWHYGNKSDDGKTCTAGANSAEFLVLLNSNYGVHMALEQETIPFKVRVSEQLTAKRKDGGVIEYCEDVAYDEKGEYVTNSAVVVESIKALDINEKE